jgi:hypothetical protein
MITNFKIFEESTLDDFNYLQVGDILIAKDDIFISYPNYIERNFRSKKISFFGDKLFLLKGKKKKISKIIKGNIFLSGLNFPVDINTLDKLFTIKDVELKKDMKKYNL